MMAVLDNIEPKRALFYFEEISKIPHGSTNTKAISDYCVKFATEHGLEYIQDEKNNLIIFKDAFRGYEGCEPVIIQGHLDMVCEQDNGRNFNVYEDSLELFVEDGMLGARGTTLGADDGIAVAYMLALLEDDTIKAPKLECVFTVDEEIGMLGIAAMDLNSLKGRRMINIDHGLEGDFLVGCAGGITACVHVPVSKEKYSGKEYEIEISGATGGHSGEEIDKQRANTNVLMGRILFALSQTVSFRLVSVTGGFKDNAIPRKTVARLLISEADAETISAQMSLIEKEIKSEYELTDPKLAVTLRNIGFQEDTEAFNEISTNKIISVIYSLPGGITKMSNSLLGLVQSSLNMGILDTKDDSVCMSYCVRSSVESEKWDMCNKLKAVAFLAGGKVSFSGNYPAWEYSEDSALSHLLSDIYIEMTGKKPTIGTIHAGLECGVFFEKLEKLDCISIGPTMHEIHTTRERLNLASAKRTWDFLLRILERLQ